MIVHQRVVSFLYPPTEELMPRNYQNGKLLKRTDVARPYYYVQVTAPIIGSEGKRKKGRKKERLGFCDEIIRAKSRTTYCPHSAI